MWADVVHENGLKIRHTKTPIKQPKFVIFLILIIIQGINMNYIRIFILTVLAVSFNTVGESIVPVYESLTVQSKALGTEKTVTVHLPEGYEKSSNQQYPVLYTVDAQYYLDHIRAITSTLSSTSLMPKIIIIGIDSDNRRRDYTPTQTDDVANSGGANKFLDFIEFEIMPKVDSNYNTSEVKIFSGHSLGGLLSLHAFYTRPSLFTAHFAFSPSLYWDNMSTVQNVKSYLENSASLKQFLYINMGDEGLKGGTAGSKLMRKGFIALKTFLENHKTTKNFWFGAEHLESENHGSTMLVGAIQAFRTLYRHWELPFRVSEKGIEAIEQHYKYLSKDLFREVKPSEADINYHARYLMHILLPEKSIDLYQYNIKHYPNSPEAQFSLASTYKKINKLQLAKTHAISAINLSTKDGKQLKQYQEFLNTLKTNH